MSSLTEQIAVGVIGLGKMGLPLSENLRDKGYKVIGHDTIESARHQLSLLQMTPASSYTELCVRLTSPRIIILVVPAGEGVDAVISQILPNLAVGDVLIDAGNSHYKDSCVRSEALACKGIIFFDVGMSGGVIGARNGPCLTIGGRVEHFSKFEFLFKDIALPNGYFYVGSAGWGHLVKTIHNGIEYGFMQAIAEGLHIIKATAEKNNTEIDLVKLCEVWGHGSIIASRLLDDTVSALKLMQQVKVSGSIGGGETGRWALQIAHEQHVKAPALAAALEKRECSQFSPDFAGEVIAAIRNVFGGHTLTLPRVKSLQ